MIAHAKGLDIYWQMFRHFRNVVSNSFKIAKHNYYTDLILENTNKSKLMWKCLKEFLPGKVNPNLKWLLVNGKIITNVKGIANAYNEYFTSIGNDLVSKLPPHNPSNLTNSDLPSSIPTFHFPMIPTDFVENQLSHMPESKAVGLDKISSRLLRIVAPIISKPLTLSGSMLRLYLCISKDLLLRETIIDQFQFY